MIDKLARAAKAWLAAIVAGVGVLELAVADEVLTLSEGVRVAAAFFGALAIVYNVSNAPVPPNVVVLRQEEEQPRAA